jgi:hypothetical protein
MAKRIGDSGPGKLERQLFLFVYLALAVLQVFAPPPLMGAMLDCTSASDSYIRYYQVSVGVCTILVSRW